MKNISRKKFIKNISYGSILLPFIGSSTFFMPTKYAKNKILSHTPSKLFFKISLAQWSLNRSIFGKSRELGWEGFMKQLKTNPDSLYQGDIDPMDFPTVAKKEFGIDAIELVNTFYFSKAQDTKYLSTFKKRCDDEGVKCLLIMCDAEGYLGNLDTKERAQSVKNHYKWIDAAKFLGCHSIRVNAGGEGDPDEIKKAVVESLSKLTEYGKKNHINIIVENHGGYSSNAEWLVDIMKQVNSPYCGTLPDFGNFCIERNEKGCVKEYDKYKGIKELMPFAKGVSAKANSFDNEGNETNIDFKRMLNIVKESGFTGYIGIEFESNTIPEKEGIRKTLELLKKSS